MLNWISKFLIIIMILYGSVCFLYDFVLKKVYRKRVCESSCLIIVRNIENEIEEYIREIKYFTSFKDLIIIDLESSDETLNILRKLEQNQNNLIILSMPGDKKIIENLIKYTYNIDNIGQNNI